MRFSWLLTVLAFVVFGATAHATTQTVEISPEDPHGGPVNVSSERLANGDIQFSVAISRKLSGVNYNTSLGVAQITDHGALKTLDPHFIRRLPADQNEGVIKCTFSVTQKELEDSDLCFTLGSGGEFWVKAEFIRLRKFSPH